MAFSSFPTIYLDHPNLQQFHQEQQHELGHRHGGVESSSQIQPPQPPSGVQSGMVVGGLPPLLGGSSIRPGSMVDRARQAKLPVPEAGLKCPRCDSSNTKFCYFNNYNLSQPRHFCKTCRRYWTRGGALRNVPVGGGCRRNKKSKSSSSKTTLNSDRQMGSGGANSTSNTTPCPSNSTLVSDMSMSMTSGFPHTVTHLPLMSALQNLNHYAVGPMGSNLGGFSPNMGFSLGRNFGQNNEDNDLSGATTTGGGVETWRLPPIGGYEQLANNLFPFQGEGIETTNSDIGDQNVKSEESPAANLRKQFQINTDINSQYWNGNPWTGFSGFSGGLNSSSTSHLL